MKILAYLLSGAILLIIADVAPNIALGTTGLIVLATILTHTDQINNIAQDIKTQTA